MGWIIFITGLNPLVIAFVNLLSVVMSNIFGRRYRVFKDPESALAFLLEQDDELRPYFPPESSSTT